MTERLKKSFLISLVLLLIFLVPIYSQETKKGYDYKQRPSIEQQAPPGSVVKEGEPLEILITQKFNKTRVRVGEEIASDIIIQNKSGKRIFIGGVFLEGGDGKLKFINSRLEKDPRPIDNGAMKKSRIYFVAVKTGKEMPPRIKYKIHFINFWIRDGNTYNPYVKEYIPQNSLPLIEVTQVKLPGVEEPLRNLTKEINNYYSFFTFKILGIALLIIAILWIIDYAANSNLVYSLFSRVLFTYFMALILSLFLVLVWNGINWVLQATLPSHLKIGIILGFSCQFTIAFGMVSRRKLLFQSLFYGILLGLISYAIYVGFKAFEYNNFYGFSFQKVIFMSSVIGLALNIIFLRKRKQKRRTK